MVEFSWWAMGGLVLYYHTCANIPYCALWLWLMCNFEEALCWVSRCSGPVIYLFGYVSRPAGSFPACVFSTSSGIAFRLSV